MTFEHFLFKIHESLAWDMSNDLCVNTLKAPSYSTGRVEDIFLKLV